MKSWQDARATVELKWKQLNKRERIITGVAIAMLLLVLGKTAFWDPQEKVNKGLRKELEEMAKKVEVMGKEKEALMAEAVYSGPAGVKKKIEQKKEVVKDLEEKLKARNAWLLDEAGAWKWTREAREAARSSGGSFELGGVAAAEGLEGVAFEHRLRVAVDNNWAGQKRVLGLLEGRGALHLKELQWTVSADGSENKMELVIGVLSANKEWKLGAQ